MIAIIATLAAAAAPAVALAEEAAVITTHTGRRSGIEGGIRAVTNRYIV